MSCRAKFITGTVRALLDKEGGGRHWLYSLRDVPYREASQALCELPGIGPKVGLLRHMDLRLVTLYQLASRAEPTWTERVVLLYHMGCRQSCPRLVMRYNMAPMRSHAEPHGFNIICGEPHGLTE